MSEPKPNNVKKPSSRRRRNPKGTNQRSEQPQSNQKPTTPRRSHRPKPSKKPNESSKVTEELRKEELEALIYRISDIDSIKLLNSTNRSKIFKVDLKANGKTLSMKLTVPILKKNPIYIDSLITAPKAADGPAKYKLPSSLAEKNLIRNFNSKVKSNDKSLLFYLNCLVNDAESLTLDATSYKFYSTLKIM